MNYIIFDLELNSKAYKSKLPNEIIEIGAVKLNYRLEEESTFQSLTKPKIHRKLFPIIKRKTKILQQDINDAENFRDILENFKQWIGDDYILCSWGSDDIHHLKLNCKLNRLGIKWIKRTFDIQSCFSQMFEAPPGHKYSLTKALDTLSIVPSEELHRAYVDAKYTAEVFRRIYNEEIFKNHQFYKNPEFTCSKI